MPAAAGVTIFNDDSLAERVAHPVSNGAGHDIVGAAGRQRDDENNEAAGIIVGGLARRGEQSCRQNPSQRRYACQALLHFFLAEPAAASR